MSVQRNAKIRLAHVIGELGMGGMELGVIRQSNALCKKNFDVTVVCFDGIQEKAISLLSPEIKVLQITRRPGIDWMLILKLAKILYRQQIDIVHSHNWTTYLYAVLAARFALSPAIIHGEHGRDTEEYDSDWKKLRVRKFLASQCDFISTVSPDILEILINTWNVPQHKLSFLPNGVNLDQFKPANDAKQAKLTIGINESTATIGTIIGTFRPIKGLPVLLKATQRISRQLFDLKLVIVGDGPVRQEMEDLAKELNIGHTVRFLGKRTDIPKILSAIDVYVNCSLYEGMSNTILEALACGIPVVATAVGGTPHILQNGKYGKLIQPNSAHEISQAVCELLLDTETRLAMSKAGRKRIEENYSFEKSINNYESLYLRAINTKKRKVVSPEKRFSAIKPRIVKLLTDFGLVAKANKM